MSDEKLMPQNHDAEASVLASILIASDAIGEVAEWLPPDDFHMESYRTIYAAALALHASGKPTDLIALCDELRRRGTLEEVGGESEVSRLANNVPTSVNIRHYGEIVARTATLRRVIEATAEIADTAYADNQADLAGMIEWAANRIRGTSAENKHGKCKRRPYPILSDLEVEAFTPAQGILGDILFEDSVTYLFGDSDTWKTFLAVSWCLCIATGTPWLGRDVQQGPAVYVPAEGARGIGKRIRAWKQHHGFVGRSVDIHVIPMAVNLLDRQAVPGLVDDIRTYPRLAGRAPRIIVFDTLASSMDGGDENDTSDANRVTAAARQLKQTFNCNVLVLHHSGNAYTHRMRGNSAFRNNADTVMRVVGAALPDEQKRLPGDVLTLRSGKAKEDAGFDDIHFTTELEEWVAEDGYTPISSLVVVETDKAPPKRGELVIMPQSSRTALEALAKLNEPSIATKWLAATRQAPRTFYDARDDLVARLYVKSDAPPKTKGAHYSLTEAGRDILTANVRGECENTAAAVTELTEDTADNDTAVIGASQAANPELMGTAVTADGARGIYAIAPSAVTCPDCGETRTYHDGDGAPHCARCHRRIA